MFPIKKSTVTNLIVNMFLVAMTYIDLRAGILTVGMLVFFDHATTIIRRSRRRKQNGEEDQSVSS